MRLSTFASLFIAVCLPAVCQKPDSAVPPAAAAITRVRTALAAVPTGAFQHLEATQVEGRLVLSGLVNDSAIGQWALDAARKAAGGVPVDNRIVVVRRTTRDYVLEQEEWKKLDTDDWLKPLLDQDHPSVQITSRQGRVDLWGAVDNEGQKAVLELLANSVDGVVGVYDHTVVLHPLTDVGE